MYREGSVKEERKKRKNKIREEYVVEMIRKRVERGEKKRRAQLRRIQTILWVCQRVQDKKLFNTLQNWAMLIHKKELDPFLP